MKKAFTMIEIVVVVAIIGILSAIVAPKLMGSKTDAEIAKLKEQVRAINTSIQLYSKQKMILKGSLDEDESFPKSLNKNDVLFGAVLNGADTSKWKKGTLELVLKDNLYTYTIKGYGTFWCAYVKDTSECERLNGESKDKKHAYPIKGGWNVGDFKCYQFEDSKNKINNTVLKDLFNVERSE